MTSSQLGRSFNPFRNMPHRRSPKTPCNADILKMLFETAEFQNKSDLCKYCFKKKPQEDPDDKDAIYCSKKCAIAHAFATLSGEILEECEETVEEEKEEEEERQRAWEEEEEEEEEEESTGPLTPKEIPVAESEGERDGKKSASSRLCLRLIELGNDDDLTIENLLATLEDDDKDSSEDSERSSSRSRSSARPHSITLDYDRPTLDLFKHAIRRSLALSTGEQCANRSVLESTIEESLEYASSPKNPSEEQEAVDDPTSSTGLARDVPTGPEHNFIEGLDRSRTFGLASRLRKALNRVGSVSKRNSDIKRLSGIRNSVGVLEASTRRSQLVTPMPSGDEWNDFVSILQFMEQAGLGGSTGKSSW
ncbi:hypothetical protein Clacol_007722 [Clathrus columnatus]|uniref:Uncharacterized protein n=1 Tax=Clathrus columnatus TaxID=1419009 RepID=A0AAV5AL98_9AGAM|nr:hypothetical protein Clacol_007722 [Clathrus columnatus]